MKKFMCVVLLSAVLAADGFMALLVYHEFTSPVVGGLVNVEDN